jgi:hypothetical protein
MKEAIHVSNGILRVISPGDYKEAASSKISFFNVAELNEKLKVNFSNILLVTTDDYDRRNKLIWLKGKIKEYTLMNVGFDTLLENTNNLLMVNKSTLLSIEAVCSYRYDCITLENLFPGWNDKQITLGNIYRKGFYSRINR